MFVCAYFVFMLLFTLVYFVYKCDDAFKKEAAMFQEREQKLLQENHDLKVGTSIDTLHYVV